MATSNQPHQTISTQQTAPSDLWKACAQVIREEGKPLEICRVAQATGQTEGEIIAALIRESRADRTISFRYPPLPRAAITRIELHDQVSPSK